MSTLKVRLLEARTVAGLERSEAAARAGLAYSTLASLENGDSKESKNIGSLAAAYGVNALWLETGKGSMRDAQPVHGERDPDMPDLVGAVKSIGEAMKIVVDVTEQLVEEMEKLRAAQGESRINEQTKSGCSTEQTESEGGLLDGSKERVVLKNTTKKQIATLKTGRREK